MNTTKTEIFCKIALPSYYRIHDFLQFHNRDPLSTSARIEENSLEIGLIIENHAACLLINFSLTTAEVALLVDGSLDNFDENALISLVSRLLGIKQQVEIFEEKYGAHPELQNLIAKNPRLRMPITSTPYEAFTRSVFSQQISMAVAMSMRRKFIKQFGLEHSSGLMCYPSPSQLANCNENQLKNIGCSASKARTILDFTKRVLDSDLPLDKWLHCAYEEDMRDALLDIKGVGPWTADSTLMLGYGWLDGSMHNDLGVRKNLQSLLNSPIVPSAKQTEQWLAQFSPWRALVAIHLWKR